MGSASESAAVDATLSDMYSGLAACGELAEEKIDEYAAMIKFIGLLSGVGDPDEVEKARSDLREAISRALSVEQTDIQAAIEQNYGEFLSAKNATDIYSRFPGQSQEGALVHRILTEVGTMGGPGDLATYTSEIAGGSRTPDLSQYLESGRLSPEGEAYIQAAAENYRQAAELQQQVRDARYQAWADWWAGIGEWFSKIRQLIVEGKILETICTILAEGVFMLVEEVVIWGATAIATAAVGVATGGTGAIAAGVVVQIIARSVQAGSRVARVSLKAARRSGRNEMPEQSLARANTVDAGEIDASDMPDVDRLGDEDFENGNLTPPEREDISTPNEETSDTTRVDGDGADPDTPRPRVPGPPHRVRCFGGKHRDNPELARQLGEQQGVLNTLTPNEYLARRQAIADAGGTSPLRTDAQRLFREQRVRELTDQYVGQGMSESAAEAAAEEFLEGQAALHRLDIIAGGDPDDIARMGDSGVNSSIGPAWNGARVESIDSYARDLVANGHGDKAMNIELSVCPR